MADLKPCPFCGGTKLKVERKSRLAGWNGLDMREEMHTYSVRCNTCHARGSAVGGRVMNDPWTRCAQLPDWATTDNALEDVICEVDAQTAADVAPVVRCKECEHAERYERTDGTVGYYCGHPQNTFTYGERWDRAFKPAKEADDFCSHGERKDGEN